MKNRRKLRNILIEPFKQFAVGFKLFLLFMFFVVGSALLFVDCFKEQYQHVMDLFGVLNPEDQVEFILNQVFVQNGTKIGLWFFGYSLLFFSVVFKMTHRYYGPLCGLRRHVDQLKNGNYAHRIMVRQKDELQELVADLNELADSLEKNSESKS